MTEYKNNNNNLQFNNEYFNELYNSLWRYEATIDITPAKNKNERLVRATEISSIHLIYDMMKRIEERLDNKENGGRCNPDGSIR